MYTQKSFLKRFVQRIKVIKNAQKNWLRNFLIVSGLLVGWVVVVMMLPSDPKNDLILEATQISSERDLNLVEALQLGDDKWTQVSGREIRELGEKDFYVWVRARVPRTNIAESYYFQVEFSLLEQVHFYLLEQQKIIKHLKTGWSPDRDQDLTPQLHYVFNFTSSPNHDRYVYLRIKSPTILIAPLVLKKEHDFIQVATVRLIFVWLLLGLYIGIVIYNCVYGGMLRDRTYLWYLMTQLLVVLALCIFYTPMFRWVPYFSTNLNAVGYLLLVCLVFSGYFMCLFTRGFLGMEINFPVTLAFNRGLRSLLMLAGILIVFLPIHFSAANIVRCSTILAFLTPLYFMFIVGVDSVFMLQIALSGFVTLSAAALLSIANVTPANFYSDHLPLVGLLWCSSTLSISQAYMVRRFQKERGQIINALAADVPTPILNGILNNTFSNGLRSNEREISIMFVDIVAYSQLTEIYGHQRIFSVISRILEQITQIVVQHGGYIDRSLGDGILCFFGYGQSQGAKGHVRDAFDAAKKIQELTCRGREGYNKEIPFELPLRIGLNTSRVLIGNVGGDDRVDFTLIGTGVNLASRLETACSPYNIMVSEDFKKLLQPDAKEQLAFNKIFVPIKHYKELLTAYEYDPWHGRSEMVSRAFLAFRQHLGPTPIKKRLTVDVGHHMWFESNYGRFDIIDVSLGGVKLVAQSYLGKSCKILFQVQSTSASTMSLVKEKMLHTFYGEVKWSSPLGSLRYIHGLEFLGLNEDQKQFLIDMVLEGRIVPKFLANV
jgi:class 3 adenylate cyclase